MNSDQKGSRIAGFVLIGFGCFFTAIGVFVGGSVLILTLITSNLLVSQKDLEDFMEYAVETTGTVIEAGGEHTVVGYFDEDDIWYEAEFSVYYGKYKAGSDITVYYDEKNPKDCRVPELTAVFSDILIPIFDGVGGAFLVIFLLIGIPMIIGGIIIIKKNSSNVKETKNG